MVLSLPWTLIQNSSMAFRAGLLSFLLLWGSGRTQCSQAEETNVVQFKVSAPYSSDDEIGRRFGFRPPLPEYDIAQEKFRLVVPPNYSTNTPAGLLVWLSPSDDAYMPVDWEEELAQHNIILVAPLHVGNERHPIDRLRLACDATSNVCRRFRIDRKRIYIGGFSGGARLACMLGIACADIFSGAICVCGVNFYLHVPAGGNLYYPSSFTPSSEILHSARRYGKYVLITGEGDPGRDSVRTVAENGFMRDGFKKILFIDVPGMQHAMPGTGPLKQALAFLDEKPDSAGSARRAVDASH
jgi:hypothetical protein